MTGNSKVTITELSNLIGKLERDRSEVFKKIDNIDKQIVAIKTTMRLIAPGSKRVEEFEARSKLIAKLREEKSQGKLSQIKALEIIAKDTGKNGAFKVQDAKNIMVSVGMFKNPKNASAVLYTIMERNKGFEKVTSGVYRVVDTEKEGSASLSPSSSASRHSSTFKTTFFNDETLKRKNKTVKEIEDELFSNSDS